MALSTGITASNAFSAAFGGAANTAPFNMQAAGSFSLIYKLNAAPASNNRILGKNISAAGTRSYGVSFSVSGADYFPALTWYEPGAEVQVSSLSKMLTTWYQVVGSFDPAAAANSRFRLYFNGSQQIDGDDLPLGFNVDGVPQTNSVAFSIGKDQQTGNNAAAMDFGEFAWTSTPVSEANALAMFNGGLFKRFRDIEIDETVYCPMTDTSASGLATIVDVVGGLNGVGTGLTAAAAHPPMWYQQQVRGLYRATRSRGLSLPRLRPVA